MYNGHPGMEPILVNPLAQTKELESLQSLFLLLSHCIQAIGFVQLLLTGNSDLQDT